MRTTTPPTNDIYFTIKTCDDQHQIHAYNNTTHQHLFHYYMIWVRREGECNINISISSVRSLKNQCKKNNNVVQINVYNTILYAEY